MLLTTNGRAIRFEGKEIPIMGRTAQGVKGIDLRDDDRVVGAILVRRDASVLTMTGSGWAKRTPLSEFPLQKRGGLGTLAIPSGAETELVSALEVVADDEVAVVTASGAVSHLDVQAVPEQGRRTPWQSSRPAFPRRSCRRDDTEHRLNGGRGGSARAEPRRRPSGPILGGGCRRRSSGAVRYESNG